MKNTTRNGRRCVIYTLQTHCRTWFFHINLGDFCQNRIISMTTTLVVADWWWRRWSVKPFYFLPSKWGVGWACWRQVGGCFDCHVFLLTEVCLSIHRWKQTDLPINPAAGLVSQSRTCMIISSWNSKEGTGRRGREWGWAGLGWWRGNGAKGSWRMREEKPGGATCTESLEWKMGRKTKYEEKNIDIGRTKSVI